MPLPCHATLAAHAAHAFLSLLVYNKSGVI
jgi:hypothetical protein